MVMAASELDDFAKVHNLLREGIKARFETDLDFEKIKLKFTGIEGVSVQSDTILLDHFSGVSPL